MWGHGVCVGGGEVGELLTGKLITNCPNMITRYILIAWHEMSLVSSVPRILREKNLQKVGSAIHQAVNLGKILLDLLFLYKRACPGNPMRALNSRKSERFLLPPSTLQFKLAVLIPNVCGPFHAALHPVRHAPWSGIRKDSHPLSSLLFSLSYLEDNLSWNKTRHLSTMFIQFLIIQKKDKQITILEWFTARLLYISNLKSDADKYLNIYWALATASIVKYS